MSDIAGQNIEILRTRWPVLAERILAADTPQDAEWEGFESHPALAVSGHRLWSAYDAESEAQIQASLIPADSTEAAVYGVGSGDLVRELLKRTTLKLLVVAPLNLGLFHLLLHLLDQRDWLSDGRVALVDATVEPGLRQPFAVVPPCLALRDPAAARLGERLVQALEAPFQGEAFDRRQPHRRRQVEQNLDLVACDGDVGELFGTAPGSTVFVALGGPTLAQTSDWLVHHRSEGILIAVDGALRPLLQKQLIPDVVISIDDNRETILPYFDTDLASCRESVLVYAPVVHHDVLATWPGRRLATYTSEPIYDDLRAHHPRAQLFVAGSVSHRAVDLAVRMGAARVVLFGADFGFPEGRIHANDHAPVDFYSNASRSGTTTLNGHGQPIATMNNFNGYRISLEHYIARHPEVAFVNSSRDGAMILGTQLMDAAAS